MSLEIRNVGVKLIYLEHTMFMISINDSVRRKLIKQ
jgi:hypothetical protein